MPYNKDTSATNDEIYRIINNVEIVDKYTGIHPVFAYQNIQGVHVHDKHIDIDFVPVALRPLEKELLECNNKEYIVKGWWTGEYEKTVTELFKFTVKSIEILELKIGLRCSSICKIRINKE